MAHRNHADAPNFVKSEKYTNPVLSKNTKCEKDKMHNSCFIKKYKKGKTQNYKINFI
jgi:hypothetical protein